MLRGSTDLLEYISENISVVMAHKNVKK